MIGDGGMGRAPPRAHRRSGPASPTSSSMWFAPRSPARVAASASPPSAGRGAPPRPGTRRRPPCRCCSSRRATGTINQKLLYCPEDAGVLQGRLPACLRGTWFNGSYDGGWVAAGRPMARVVVANLFSGVQVHLSDKQGTIACPHHVWKTVFSEAPTMACRRSRH
ncbi:hypothetical protein D1007_46927 [Hordeum vulgare]|nr:hypothetical protein D1007_46927 [Hordeum vulgare]